MCSIADIFRQHRTEQAVLEQSSQPGILCRSIPDTRTWLPGDHVKIWYNDQMLEIACAAEAGANCTRFFDALPSNHLFLDQ